MTMVNIAVALALLVPYLTAGLLIGIIYFLILERSAGLLLEEGGLGLGLVLGGARLTLVIAALILAAWQGALPLIAMALGFPIGRQLVIRRAMRMI